MQDVDEDALEQGAEPEQEGAPEAEERAEGAETPQDEELSDSLDEDEAQAPAEEPEAQAPAEELEELEAQMPGEELEAEMPAEELEAEALGEGSGEEASDEQASDGAAEGAEGDSEEAAPKIGPGNQLDDEALLRETCALLFASPEPLTGARLHELLRRPERKRMRAALEALGQRLTESGLPMVLREVGGGWRLFTDPDQDPTIQRLMRSRKVERLSAAALETLSIVAYRQPVTKAEIEAIRGVQAGPMLRNLVDRGLVRVTGRAEQPGSPLEYGTTKEFLDRFGLASLKELPRDAELVRE